MNTDELIDRLASSTAAIKPGRLRNRLAIALTAGVAVAVGLMLALFGLPAGATGGPPFGVQFLALAFAVGSTGIGMSFLSELARPGKPSRKALVIIGVLAVAWVFGGITTLAFAAFTARGNTLFGQQWSICFFCIPLFALAPFAALILTLRKAAPTQLITTGAIVGLVAGSSGAAVFACCNAGAAVPFVAFWDGVTIAFCTLAGATLGPRLLRW